MKGWKDVILCGFCLKEMKGFCCFGREDEEDEGIGVICVFKWGNSYRFLVSGFWEWKGGQRGVFIGVREV